MNLRNQTASLLFVSGLAISACSSSPDAGGASPRMEATDAATASAEPTSAPVTPGPTAAVSGLTFTAADLCDLILTRADVPVEFPVAIERAGSGTECTSRFDAGEFGELPVLRSGATLHPDAETARMVAGTAGFPGPDARPFECDVGDGGRGYLVQYEKTPDGIRFANLACYWPVGNVVLFVGLSSNETVTESDVVRYALIMQARAEGL